MKYVIITVPVFGAPPKIQIGPRGGHYYEKLINNEIHKIYINSNRAKQKLIDDMVKEFNSMDPEEKKETLLTLRTGPRSKEIADGIKALSDNERKQLFDIAEKLCKKINLEDIEEDIDFNQGDDPIKDFLIKWFSKKKIEGHKVRYAIGMISMIAFAIVGGIFGEDFFDTVKEVSDTASDRERELSEKTKEQSDPSTQGTNTANP